MSAPGLRSFRDPASVAVVGASADPAKWGYWLAHGALRGAGRRTVHLVNRSAATVLGATAYPSLSALPATPELVVLAVPAAAVSGVVDEALALGVRAFLGITAGVGDEAAVAARISAAGGRLVGMNSLGIYDAATELQLTWGTFEPGSIAVISQSGQLGSEIASLAARAGMGLSRFVSVGNQTDVRAVELLDDLIEDQHTRVVALYLESFADGADLVAAIRRLRAAGKHTLLLTVGASAASSRLARSHTGSMTSALDVVDAAMRAAGATRVRTPDELVQAAALLATGVVPAGDRVAVIGDSGGQTGVAADLVGAAGLQVAEFSAALQDRLATQLPTGAACANPVDLAGAGEQDLTNYLAVAQTALESGEADAVLLTGYFGCYALDNPASAARESEVAAEIAAAAQRAGIPLAAHSMADGGPTVQTLRSHGVAVYPTIETAVGALAAAARLAAAPRTPAAPAVILDQPGSGYLAAQEFLRGGGIAFPAGRLIRDADALEWAAAALSAPYVLKASWLEHKSEAGGVSVGLADADALRAAFADMRAALGDGDYVVEEQDLRGDVVEMVVGARRDPHFGPVVLVGAGGVQAELHRDTAIELAPVDHETARAMVRRLVCHRLLTGWRGRPATDIDALAEVIVALSTLAAGCPQIAEIEVNPLRVAPDGAVAVDALIVETLTPTQTFAPNPERTPR
ncbi:acetate--CoA ligase family protein [Mycolicibacterium brumae]|uniref:CoA-binding protein n=1 Tax=Mycolicibacterium brumae TaxID=85968 RepID=A0A2G5PFH3_9MYCO|nr:acetate--CoA ligase family protein [Mycolicibacterium brumae]MCV7192626.1 acetate--CoA ligase family protein [Mycolicibacterium brumae]PIB77068.1 CoA-binding protein [Mycolicibacterium brumae]RWA18382.1 hypothetical protein MBRU_03985 [Mycolicibacterium brumae DSM 44177]UWW10396.1 acetate--CoA ligase family protein [Mycolicibacterium brumae]